MKKNVSHNFSRALSPKLQLTLLGLTAAVLVSATFLPGLRSIVLADQYDDQIKALQSQNSSTQSSVDGLASQAASYQDAIAQLQSQINGLQASIDQNTAKQAQLQAQITANQLELDREKAILATDLKTMYVDGTPSTIEMLATSKNLSDFVDKQEYRNAIQSKLQDTTKKIADLQNQLNDQSKQVAQMLQDQKSQQDQIANAQAQQANLLALNQDQQAAYTKQIQSNNSQISSLRAQQLAANQRLVGSGKVTIISGGSCGGGYPGSAAGPWGNWGCNYGLDASVDNWGMYNRECVSYTAWKVYQAYGYMPNWGGVGNANQWPGDADRYNIPRGSTPKVGSVAIGTNSYYFGSVGHAMWVEAVYGDGTILVSQYNFAGPGQYSTMRISASLMSTFIYFGG